MLAPNYYEICADEAVSLYRELENDIISDIIRRIIKTGKITATAEYQLEIMRNSELLYDDILDEISKKGGLNEKKIREIFENSGRKTVESDNEVYRENGLKTVEISQSKAMKKVLDSRAKKTFGNVKNLTLTTADTSQTAYINACNSAYMQVVSGAFSYQEAIKNAVKKTAENGVTVRYPSGKTDRMDIAVRRAVLTGVGQTAREISLINAEEAGCDLMEISAHSGARPSHAKWQGKIVSLSGKKGYLSKRDIGYGSGDGFGGWNCRHDWYPFFEGRSKRNYTEKDLQKLDEKSFKYNGEEYSEYEISQIQRKMEREIRSAKREQVAFQTAFDECDDPEIKKAMRDSLNDAKRKVAEKQAKMRDFVGQTGQDRDYFREQNYPKKNNSKKVVDNSESYGIIKSNDKFGPTEDVTEAEEYAKDVLGIKNVSYKGLDKVTANECNKVLEEHFKEFPELKKQINFVGTCQTRNELIREKVKEYYITKYEKEYSFLDGELFTSIVELEADEATNTFMKKLKIKPENYAQSFSEETEIDLREFYGISVNESFGSNNEEFIESVQKNEKAGHFPVGCNKIKSVIDHEIGHQLDDLLDLRYNPLIHSAFEEFENNPDKMGKKLSGYASKGFSETKDSFKRYSEPIAEAWSEYRNNSEPRETAEKIGRITKRLYDEKFK